MACYTTVIIAWLTARKARHWVRGLEGGGRKCREHEYWRRDIDYWHRSNVGTRAPQAPKFPTFSRSQLSVVPNFHRPQPFSQVIAQCLRSGVLQGGQQTGVSPRSQHGSACDRELQAV
jgi:hypothetical protein